MSGPTLEQFKAMQRDTWSAGDYVELSQFIKDVGVRLVESAGVRPGTAVLDVACGTGNAAIPAAAAGATVTGLDLAPALLEGGQKKAAAAGVAVDWVEGDAEELPFPDGSFDYVLSTFGHMFAPRHQRVADEMARVTRPGGLIGICCWTPDGSVGAMFAAGAAFMPPPPPFASPPVLWGARDHVREMFGERAAEIDFSEHSATITWESPEGWAAYFMPRFPVMVTAASRLGERFTELRAAVLDVWRARNQAQDGSLLLPQEYLQSLIRRAGA